LKYSESFDPTNLTNTVTIEINDLEMVLLKLDRFDRLLLDECNKSNKISDKLLALECMARRIEEQD
jgi:hypothetical protein